MSASMRVRIPPSAPTDFSDLLGETGVVEQLIRHALFHHVPGFHNDPDNALVSTDGGLTGGTLFPAGGPPRTYLDGALRALELHEGSTLPARELRGFLDGLDRHGPLLITMER